MPSAPLPDDPRLVARLRAGDQAAFEALFHAEYAGLCSFVSRLLASDDVTEEIIQSLFLRIWTTRAQLPPITSIRAFLYKSARNAALDVVKRGAVESRHAALLAAEPDDDASAGPLADLERQELEQSLSAAIARLPERSRQVVTLRWVRGMSNRDIADVLGISVKGVEISVTRALRLLRQYLGVG